MIDCQQVCKTFGDKEVLKDCQLTIQKGEIVGIMGESGSGKTTLANLILGFEQPSKGQILVDGKPYDVRRDGVRIVAVFQDAFHSVNPLFTIEDILSEALPKPQCRKNLVTALEDVGLDESYLTKTARQLSGGQLQRVCIARALLLRPEVIVFDEAFSGLDPRIQGQLLSLIYRLQAQYGYTYVFIAHDFHLCYAICHRVVVMFDGRIVDEITEFTSPLVVKHPASKNLLIESQNPKYSKCQIRKMVIQLEQETQHYGERT
ncbi:nickel transport system ATP-binding protein [Streptococcus rupicaprae]|uniref:Nickel transport system ATP-binding protein n=1 Tax=Streptococcus rupicaprae TaxID=759619 RepID=A0ABV2FF49_9STRE